MFALLINSMIYHSFGVLKNSCRNKNDYRKIIRICQKEILEYCNSKKQEYVYEMNKGIDETISVSPQCSGGYPK